MNILITGGAGYLGTALVDHLLNYSRFSGYMLVDYFGENIGEVEQYTREDHNVNITVVDNLYFNQSEILQYCKHPNFKFIYQDVSYGLYDFNTDSETKLAEELRKADVIIPLAAYVGYPLCDSVSSIVVEDLNENHIEEIVDFLNMENLNNKIILFPNTNSGYGKGVDNDGELQYCTEESELNPISLYGKTKVNAEKYLRKNYQNFVCFRLATVFGPSPRFRFGLLVNDFVYQAKKEKTIVLYESHFKRNYIHVDDVARTFVYAINNFHRMKGEVYNVGLSSANLSKLELCEKIKEYVPELTILQVENKKDPDQRNYIVSNEKLESLGWKPKYTLDDGIQQLLKAYEVIGNVKGRFSNV